MSANNIAVPSKAAPAAAGIGVARSTGVKDGADKREPEQEDEIIVPDFESKSLQAIIRGLDAVARAFEANARAVQSDTGTSVAPSSIQTDSTKDHIEEAIEEISKLIITAGEAPEPTHSSATSPEPNLPTIREPALDSDDEELLKLAPTQVHEQTYAAESTLNEHPHLEVRSCFLFLLTLRDLAKSLDSSFAPLLSNLARASTNRSAALLAKVKGGMPGLQSLAEELRAGKWEVWYEASARMAAAAGDVDAAMSPLCRTTAFGYQSMSEVERTLFLRFVFRQ